MADVKLSGEDLETAWRSIQTGVARAQLCIDEAVEQAGVPAPWFAVLLQLLHAPGRRLPMTVLANEVAMTPGGFSKLADRMARVGLLDRRGSTSDRRVVHVALTPDGLTLVRQARRAYRQAIRTCLLDAIDAADLTAASTTLRRLAEAHADH